MASDHSALNGLRLLLVEDNSCIRELLTEYLQLENIIVLQAENGSQAIEAYKQNDINVCLVDIGLPDSNGSMLRSNFAS